MRTLRFTLNGFSASVALPEHFFDERGVPRWHLLNARFGSPAITWNQVIGGVPTDEEVVEQATQSIPIEEELRKLREVVESLDKKCDGVQAR
jgi:hypothetical protein